MRVGKPKSKRTPVRLRHKIEKASAAKQRKLKKQAKNDPTWRSKMKKDPGVPNLFPYKEKFLQKVEEKARLRAEQQDKRRQLQKGGPVGDGDVVADDLPSDFSEGSDMEDGDDDDDDDDDMMADVPDDSSNPLAALLASATARATEFEQKQKKSSKSQNDQDDSAQDDSDSDDGSRQQNRQKDSSRRAYDKVFKQVIDTADVVLYVLDARDPEGSRSREVEQAVMSAAGGDKRLILVLNKADLVPLAVLNRWLVHLRQSFPTVPLRAASGGSAKVLSSKGSNRGSVMTVKQSAEALLRSLKQYAARRQLKRAISVGVVGYPNVGKSSVINALAARLGRTAGVCTVGAEAGVTTGLKQVKLDKTVTLIDSPGIVFADSAAAGSSADRARLVLLNALPPKEVKDPISAVRLLLGRLAGSPERLEAIRDVYGLPALLTVGPNDDPTDDFLLQVARHRGRLGRGGVPNMYAAAQTVLVDWRDGRIGGWIEPPSRAVETADAEVVSAWADEFKIEGLWGESEAVSSVVAEGEAMLVD